MAGPSRLGLVDRVPPPLPGDDWVRIEVLLCGICGSDLGNVSYRSSPAMEPFGSFPAVLGHEILGRVAEVGSGVTHVGVGDRSWLTDAPLRGPGLEGGFLVSLLCGRDALHM